MKASHRSEHLVPGLEGHAEAVVTPALTAAAVGSGTADVYASPAVIALMEAAAVACTEKYLAPGETSVGVHLEVSHRAATPPGMKVSAKATLIAMEGRKLVFAIEARDTAELIGDARHTRVIVDRARFEAKAKAKTERT